MQFSAVSQSALLYAFLTLCSSVTQYCFWTIMYYKPVTDIIVPCFCSSHVGSGSHCGGGAGVGRLLHLLCFQEMLWEEEKAKENAGEEGGASQNGKRRRRRAERK